MASVRFNVRVHAEDGACWAEVDELPGCFASGKTFEELKEALLEAVQLCFPEGVDLGSQASVARVDETHALVTA